MSSTTGPNRTAIAALAALSIGALAITTTADAARRGGNTIDNPVEVKSADGEEVALVLESEDNAGDNNSAGEATTVEAPNDDRFAIRGDLSKSDSDGMCRDVDFLRIEKLAPDTGYCIILNGPIKDKMVAGWISDTSSVELSGPDGKLCLTADENGVAVIALSADADENFDGVVDGAADTHGLCGDYNLLVELSNEPVIADLNGDGAVNVDDVRAMLAVFGDTDNPVADLDSNGIVDSDDLRAIVDIVGDKKGRKLAKKEAKKAEKIAKRLGLTKEEVARQVKVFRETPVGTQPSGSDRGR